MKEYSTVIGMDLGDKQHHFCVLNSEGAIEQEGRVTCSKESLQRTFGAYESALVAIATGTHSKWVCRELEELGHTVLVANVRKVRAIYSNERKCDELDAQMLARIARLDPKLLYSITHRGEKAQADLNIIRSRDSLVVARTKLINHVRGVIKSHGERVGTASAESFHKARARCCPRRFAPPFSPYWRPSKG